MCVQGLLFSENKKNRLRENKQVRLKRTLSSDACPRARLCSPVSPLSLQSPSLAKAKADRAVQKVGELIHSSPSILSSKGETSRTLCVLYVYLEARELCSSFLQTSVFVLPLLHMDHKQGCKKLYWSIDYTESCDRPPIMNKKGYMGK